MELIVDNFAGGGGASTGIEAAIGRAVDLAVNHSQRAIEIHKANHPGTHHLCEDIFDVDPREACKGRRVGLAWFSPDCTHHSRAKGGKPRSKKIRALAWVVVRWAATVRPRVIMLENVPEFQSWGPLTKDGRPDPAKKGRTFASWIQQLRDCGYEVEWRELVAADYGAPTTRRRFFLIARCDGQPIIWPAPTHGAGRLPYRTAAECIDWSLPCPSIFERKRPLAENTMKRVARGIYRYVIDHPDPFIVTYYGPKRDGDWRGQPMDAPLPTQTTENRFGLVTPTLVNVANSKTTGRAPNAWPVTEPVRTITTAPGFAVVAPCLAQTGYGERAGQAPRAQDIDAPLGTVVAGGQKHALVAPVLDRQFGESKPQSVGEPASTIVGVNHHALCAAFLAKHYGGVTGHKPDRPIGTVTGTDHHGVAACYLSKLYGTSTGADMREPMATVTGQGNHIAEVRAFLIKYYGAAVGQSQSLKEPLHTITAKHRMGLVTAQGIDYQIVDIGLRMLQPHELLLAQGFPRDYVLLGSKADRVAMIGNSVPPAMAEALVKANYEERVGAAAAAV